ncbi:hypothetical protein ANANG_G00308390 [Anguilla anguilla]|uniref:Uncharacterized protein n=1 Tax=Anguilla anguilla TaxID=7936 RepID=A0A9D3LHT4_ANGAN|nr:hypothetical protein ANANG_G00308390 [Anguilla anguilla]
MGKQDKDPLRKGRMRKVHLQRAGNPQGVVKRRERQKQGKRAWRAVVIRPLWLLLICPVIAATSIKQDISKTAKGKGLNDIQADLPLMMEKHLTPLRQSNMFYQWMEYSAREVTEETCITCYNRGTKRIPHVKPLPFTQRECKGTETQICHLECLLYYMAKGPKHLKPEPLEIDGKRKPAVPILNSDTMTDGYVRTASGTRWMNISKCRDILTPVDETMAEMVPPAIVNEGIEFPICVAQNLIPQMGPSGPTLRYRYAADPQVNCGKWDWKSNRGCTTSDVAPIKCREVVDSYGYVSRQVDATGAILQAVITVPDFTGGTRPLADVYWYCGNGTKLRATLKQGWKGICAPVGLTGRLTVMKPRDPTRRMKRGVKEWVEDSEVSVNWAGIPVNIPRSHRILGLDSSDNLIAFLPWVQIKRNVEWINYLWYNQQRFINHTVAALQGISEQLHATSLMTVQNRLILDTMLAEEQGV